MDFADDAFMDVAVAFGAKDTRPRVESKKKKKEEEEIIRGLAKWRRNTVDFADDAFMDVAVAFGAKDTRPRVESKKKKKEEEEKLVPDYVTAAGPIVIGAANKQTEVKVAAAEPAQQVNNASNTNNTQVSNTQVSAAQKNKVSAEMPAYIEVDLKQIPGDVYALMGSSTLVISIGKDAFNMTNMTANAGGALGYQSGKAVAYCTLSAEQPYEAIEKADSYKLKLYDSKQPNSEPLVIIECKKLPAGATPQAGQPRTYVGEIIKLLMKK